MDFGAHTNASTPRARKMTRGVVSACLALVFACVIGAFALFHSPLPQPDSQELAIEGSSMQPDGGSDAPALADANDDSQQDTLADLGKAYEPNEVLVSLDTGVSAATVNQTLASLDFVVTKTVTDEDLATGLMRVELAEGSDVEDCVRTLTLAGLRTQPNYVYEVADDGIFGLAAQESAGSSYDPQAAVTTHDPLATGNNRWQVESVYAPLAWGIERCGETDSGGARSDRVSVAVVDTGVKTDHIDLRDNIVASYNSATKTEGKENVADDNQSHGTHVAGIVSARSNNSVGITGVSYNAGLVAIKAVSTGTRTFNTFTLANAYKWLFQDSAADPSKSNAEFYNVRVVNLSLGGAQRNNIVADDDLTECIRSAALGTYKSGAAKDSILTVAAGGNSDAKYEDGTAVSLPFINYPGDFSYCLSVISLQRDMGWSAFNNIVSRSSSSNYNVDNTHIKNISAPGANVYSTINAINEYANKSGTSMAAPVVSGVAALIFSENPALDYGDVSKLIYSTATDLETSGWDTKTGYGEIHAYHALQIASAKLGGSEQIEYKNRASFPIVYGDDTGWETYGSPADWTWSIDNPDVAQLVIDNEAKDISLVAIAPGTVTLTGVYKDPDGNPVEGITVTKTATVQPLDISKASIVVEGDCAYTGAPLTPKPTVTMAGTELIEGVDYTVSYESNVDIGRAFITITGIGNAAGTAMGSFIITEANIDDAVLSPVGDVPYIGQAYEPTPSATIAGFGQLEEGKDFTYEYEDNVNAGEAKVRVKGMGGFKGVSSWQVFNILPVNLSDARIADIDPIVYTSTAITPQPAVTLPDGATLVQDVDYALSYSDNIDVSTQAVITVTGIGNYTGTVSKSFAIEPYGIESASITGLSASYTFTGVEIEPEVTVSLAGMGTLDDDSCTISYSSNIDAGTATVTATGIGNYTGSATTTFDITPVNLSATTIAEIPTQAFNGSPLTPVPSVMLGDVELVVDRDFTLSYANNGSTGMASVTITGKGNTIGSVTKSFKIDLPLSPDMVSPIPDQPYTGSAIEPGITVATTGISLVRNEHFTVEFTNNLDVGTATVKITGVKDCAGETTATFRIVPIDLARAAVAPVGSYTYTGNPVTPTPDVSLYGFGDLQAGTDFTYEYRFNTDAGAAQLRVVGMGNFTGSTDWLDCTFEIDKQDISAATISIPAQLYTGAALTPDPVVKVGGRTLTKGIDYRVSYYNNLETGDATAVIEGRGNYKGSKEAKFQINETIMPEMIAVSGSPTYSGSAQTPSITVRDRGKTLTAGEDYEIEGYANNVNAGTATVTVVGKGRYYGKANKGFTIKPQSLADAAVTVSSQRHTGSALRPEPTVTLEGFGTLTKGTDYTLEYADNVNVGTASIVVNGTGNYAGSKRASFAIVSSDTEGDGASVKMQRLYNSNSGEHFYTASANERDSLIAAGWTYEGYGWTAPVTSSTPVYRLYNPIAGDHHYTMSAEERAALLAAGWNDEGIGWYSDDQQRVPLYRQYNANAIAGSHNYTTSLDEHLGLIGLGWVDEGVAWFGL